MRNKILVVGSSNTDMVIQSAKLPAPGETILGGQFLMNPGGKGANQAVAAAKLGGAVTFIARVGDDLFGENAISGFQKNKIDTRFIAIDKQQASGVALIMVDGVGENCISVALGANAKLSPADIDASAPVMPEVAYLLVQLEIPIATVQHAIQKAVENGIKVVLNPASAQQLPDDLYANLSIITPNETEAALLTGLSVDSDDAVKEAAHRLQGKGVETVIITRGSKGSYVLSPQGDFFVEGIKAKALDTTAAGDTFNGALVVGLTEGMSLTEAVAFANKAAAISVTRMGAQSSGPTRQDMDLEAF